ncbi:MAG TPA: helix-turn-helix domain-containing protein [Gemmatimonadales bacterium]
MIPSFLAPVVRAVLDAVGAAIVIIAPDGRLVHANPAARRALGQAFTDHEFDLDRFLAESVPRAPDVTVVRLRTGAPPEVLCSPENGADTLANRERRVILERLENTGWKLAETARQLGISRTTLWRRLRTYGLTRHDGQP